jgi:hypothetical protein
LAGFSFLTKGNQKGSGNQLASWQPRAEMPPPAALLSVEHGMVWPQTGIARVASARTVVSKRYNIGNLGKLSGRS